MLLLVKCIIKCSIYLFCSSKFFTSKFIYDFILISMFYYIFPKGIVLSWTKFMQPALNVRFLYIYFHEVSLGGSILNITIILHPIIFKGLNWRIYLLLAFYAFLVWHYFIMSCTLLFVFLLPFFIIIIIIFFFFFAFHKELGHIPANSISFFGLARRASA